MGATRPLLFVAPALDDRTGGEIYNGYLIRGLEGTFEVTRIETLKLRAGIAGFLKRLHPSLASKHRVAMVLTRTYLLFRYASRRRHMMIDWESVADCSWLASISKFLGGRSIIMVFHFDPPARSEENQVWRLRRKRLRVARAVITISAFVAKQLEGLKLRRPITILEPGILKQRRTAGASAPHKLLRRTDVKLLFVGSLIARKDVLLIIEALGMVESTSSLFLVGDLKDTEYVAKLHAAVEARGLGDRIHFVGRVDDAALAGYYSEADLFVFPSVMEGYGIALAEAVHAGLPVVAARAGAIPELVCHNVNGLLFTPGSARELATALDILCRDSSLRARMSSAALERAAIIPDWELFQHNARGFINGVLQ